MSRNLRVGIIGVNARGGWARDGHVPAVRGLHGLELAAIASSTREGADAAAKAFGIPAAFGSGLALIAESDVDVVAITTRVPDHRDLVLAALRAGKHVYCEWPLGCGRSEAEEMAFAASAAGVHVAIGLQLRGSPVVACAADLIRSGRIGRIFTARAYASTAGFGPVVPDAFVYLEDPSNFANLATIQGGHTLDLAFDLVGEPEETSALLTRQYPEIQVGDHRDRRPRTTYDHILVTSRLARGGALAVEVAGGRPPDTPFFFEIVGESGVLRLDGGAARGFQSGRLTLSVDGATQRIDEGELASMPDSAVNVAGVYAQLRDDITHGSATAAGFEHAVTLTRRIGELFRSSESGTRIRAGA